MENKIDKIITLSDNTEHMILEQGNYNGKSYYLTSILDADGNVTKNLTILEAVVEDNKTTVKSVEDEKLLKALQNYFKTRVEKWA